MGLRAVAASVQSTVAFATANGFVVNGGTVTTSAPVLNLSQTWNGATVVFTAIKLSVAVTAASASSLLLDLQAATAGTTSKFSVDQAGAVIAASTLTFSGGYIISGGGNYMTFQTPQGQVFQTGLADAFYSYAPALKVGVNTAQVTGGAITAGILPSATTNFGIFWGLGAPSIAAPQGSIYMRSDATGATSRLYVQGPTATAAGWINVTMAA